MESFGSSVSGMRGCVKVACRFYRKAIRLAQEFFRNRHPQDYAEYWNQNKVGDFNDQQVAFKVKVFDMERDQSE